MHGKEPLILLVDDDPSVRKGIGRLFTLAGYEVEAFASAESFLDRLPCEEIACIVLDVRMPGLDGIALQRELKRAGCELPIVFLTGHGDIPMGVSAVKHGAADFLTKPVDSADLLRAVATALAGHRQEQQSREEREAIRQLLATLTPRETDVFHYLLTGLLNKQIGGELGIAEKTVKIHRAQVMAKLGVHSVAELVHMAHQVGIDPPAV
ncbi:MAG: response regulator transcription factor [Victivallales bacterium]|jgi:FixJ family two-component response regulator|nr:response regulator transcription factor [Victivallales bacterium]MBT7299018.1 response regulator transcription factor [Victivallales bacterium]